MQIQKLEPITIAAGDCVKLQFEFVSDMDLDYSSFTGHYLLSPYDNENINDFSKTMTGNSNVFEVELTSSETLGLCGTYTAKVILIDDSMQCYKRARGTFVVKKDTNSLVVD